MPQQGGQRQQRGGWGQEGGEGGYNCNRGAGREDVKEMNAEDWSKPCSPNKRVEE